jgi:hypothetical protein
MKQARALMKCCAPPPVLKSDRLVGEDDQRQHAGETDHRSEDFGLVDHGCVGMT